MLSLTAKYLKNYYLTFETRMEYTETYVFE